jgi:hypothetical protein
MDMKLKAAFHEQAKSCAALGSPFMERLMNLLARHWPDDTALAQRFAHWEGDISATAAALPLRVAGGLHALVLMARDANLAAVYPPHIVDDSKFTNAVVQTIKHHDAFLCCWVDNAPQTNEVRRSAVLIAASHWLDARYHLPLHVSELGASAGLNMQFDKFAMLIGDEHWGPTNATVRLAPEWRGPTPPHSKPHTVERRGVDLNPLHVGQSQDELRLISYIWPDQPERIARTRVAMALQDAPVDKGDAVDWLAKHLVEPRPGCLHLIYHTIAWQYFPRDSQTRGREMIEAAGMAATDTSPIAWLAMEADDNPNGAALTLRLWPGDIQLTLGRAGFHGQWVEWINS